MALTQKKKELIRRDIRRLLETAPEEVWNILKGYNREMLLEGARLLRERAESLRAAAACVEKNAATRSRSNGKKIPHD